MPPETHQAQAEPSLPFAITDTDIAAIGRAMGRSFGDRHRSCVLQCLTSCDIQAGPGSGKTTLLVAKLALLAQRWPWPDRGICVLSHTNVARREVETRVERHPSAHRLLCYPHFVGTIQTFVHQFLALPVLRSKQLDLSAIDNDRFRSRALYLLGAEYRTAYKYLKQKRDGDQIVAGLRYEGPDMDLGTAYGTIPAGAHTPTYKDLVRLKNRVAREGIFRFDDMYAIAQYYLKRYPDVGRFLQARFPFVFVDEIQDTDRTQYSLLNQVFGDQVALQRFGDINQSIFRGSDSTELQVPFPQGTVLEVPDSLRFGSSIAAVASCLTASQAQILQGNPQRPEPAPALFLFDKDSIKRVLPAFGALLLDAYNRLPPDFCAKAVGFRKSGSGPKNTPYSIADYWDGFQPEPLGKTSSPQRLVDCVRKAHVQLHEQRACGEPHSTLVEGALRLLALQGARTGSGDRFTKTSLFEALEVAGCLTQFRELLYGLLVCSDPLDSQEWRGTPESLLALTEACWDGELTPDAREFLEWSDAPPSPMQESGSGITNVFRHSASGRSVDIAVSTIHGVKGESHTATLVLETFDHSHDVRKLMPFLAGKGNRNLLENQPKLRDHMKRIYVGVSRPRELLCMAVRKDHLGHHEEALKGNGWVIRDLTST